MKGFLSTAAMSLLAATGLASPVNILQKAQPVKVRAADGFQNTVYFTNWGIYDRNFQPADLPVGQINQVLHSFLNLRPDGTVFSGDTYADLEKHYEGDSWDEDGENAYGIVKQMFKLKKENRHLKVLISIGGWSWSENFAAVAGSAETRTKFAQSAVKIMGDWGYDGVDIDWEYPASPAEGDNYQLLLDEVRKELDSYAEKNADGYHFLLTGAMPAGKTNYENMKVGECAKRMDFLNLMAYDYAGSWDKTSGHQANLYPSDSNPTATPFSTEACIKDYLELGVPAEKIVFGLPLYGRGFEKTEGLGKPYEGLPKGSWEEGIWDYKVLPQDGAEEKYDEEAGASYSYNSATKSLVSYDTPDMVKEKLEYLKEKGLGGTMFWEASGDKKGEGSLINVAFTGQGGEGSLAKAENNLKYPASIYQNIKNGLQ